MKYKIVCPKCKNTLTVENDLSFEFNFEPTWGVACRKCGDIIRQGYNLGEEDRPYND